MGMKTGTLGTGWDGDTACRDGVGMGANPVGWSGDGDRNNGDGWEWGQVLVPVIHVYST